MSPCITTFPGSRIAGGRRALDLPLELAAAILERADGVIDMGAPVSADLGDACAVRRPFMRGAAS